jgi:hypothetical protein
MTTALVLTAAVLVLLALVVLALRRLSARAKADLDDVLEGRPAERMETVLGLGLESLGRAQVRGNGSLALVEDDLLFVQWVPRRETRIPRAAITAVETPRAFLGKTLGSRLLAVTWRTPEGGQDRAAWKVRDLDAWLAALSPGSDRA